VERQPWSVVIADKPARRSERVASDDVARSRDANAACTREAADIGRRIVKHAAQGFSAAGEAEGFGGLHARWRLGRWRRARVTPEGADAGRIAILNHARIAWNGERETCGPGFRIAQIARAAVAARACGPALWRQRVEAAGRKQCFCEARGALWWLC